MTRPPMVPSSTIAQGAKGEPGLPGVNAVPADEAVAAYIAGPSDTATAHDAATGANLADPDSASYAGAAAAFPPDPKPDLIGGTVRYYGDSWASGYGLGAGNSFIQKAAEDHGITTSVNLAVPGSAAQLIGTLMLSAGAFQWNEGDADLLVICAGLNDARYNDLSLAANSKWLKSMRNSLRLAAALAMGKERVGWDDYSRWSYTGTWLPGSYIYSSNGATVAATTTPGATGTFTFEGDEGTIVVGGYISESTAVVDFYLDGEKVRTVRLFDDTVLYPGSAANVGWRAERFAGLTPGEHSLKVVKADDTNAAVYVDCGIERSDNPTQMKFAIEPILPADVYALYDPYDNGNDASIKAMQGVIDDVVTEFSGIQACRLPELIPVTDFQADLIHPNTLGRDKLRAALNETLDPPLLVERVDDLVASSAVARALGVPREVEVTQFILTLLAPYTIPEGAKALRLRGVAGGGGGGSGRRAANLSQGCGGGGGAGGGAFDLMLPTFGLPPILYVTAGNGGAGGAAITLNSTDGNNGVHGIASYVVTDSALPADESIYLAYAPGGTRGTGGTAATGPGGASVPSQRGLSGNGGAASAAGGAGATTTTNGYNGVGQGGGAGGGLTAGNVAAAGGNGWWSSLFLTSVFAAPVGGANTGVAGGTGVPTTRIQGRLESEASGAGGGASLASAAGAGGKGGRGSGGGGGGASRNGFASGAGGAGGDGFVEITAYF